MPLLVRVAALAVAVALLAGCGDAGHGSGGRHRSSTGSSPVMAQPPTQPSQQPTQAPFPLAGVTVVVDAGHNRGNFGHTKEIARQVPDGRGGTKPCNT
ncbi:MAG: hypothetical protein ACRD3Q_09200, partial [Terriglobales bacterium]